MKTKFNILWTLPLIFPVFAESCGKDEIIEEPKKLRTSKVDYVISADEKNECFKGLNKTDSTKFNRRT